MPTNARLTGEAASPSTRAHRPGTARQSLEVAFSGKTAEDR